MNNKVRFAIIGCGRISYRHIEAIQANPQAQLVALCDLNLARAQERNAGVKVKVYQDYHEMLAKEDIHVVCIMTPSGMHAEHAVEIMDGYRKHVVIEKPMTLSLDGGTRLMEAANRNKVRIFVVHQNRFNNAIKKIKSGIDTGSFGKLVLGTIRLRWSRTQSYYDRDPWRGTWAFDGGVLTNQAIHHIDLLQWFMGEIESVSAIGATQLVNIEAEDTACGWIKFRNGAVGVIEATNTARPANNDLEASISILGDKGVAIVEGASVNKLTTWTIEKIDLEPFSQTPPNVYGFGHNDIIDNVVDVVRNGGKPLVTAEEAMKSIRLLHALYSSIESGGGAVRMSDNPVSRNLGVIDEKARPIADLYRTTIALTKN